MHKVLVVDDAAFMRGSLKLILERNGFTVVGEAENGAIAINKYRELLPDLVTMDITMPEMDGLESLQEIRKIDPKAKVLVISAMGQSSSVMQAIELGAIGFIVKPFKEENIIKYLNKILQSI